MNNVQQQEQYDPNVIIQQANEVYANKKENLESAQMIYQGALLDWVDDTREMENSGRQDIDIQHVKDAIATLWIAYAHLNQLAEKFKAATEAYEQATNCPIAGKMGKVYKEYANYNKNRQRYKSAQSIYLRALVGDKDTIDIGGGQVSNSDEQNELWNDFLIMMRKTSNDPTMTLDQLRQAVDSEHTTKAREEKIQADLRAAEAANAAATAAALEPAIKRAKLDNKETPIMNHQPASKISGEVVQVIASSVLKATDNISDALKAEWLARDGTGLPSRPQPPLFNPSPPKLGDPSGKGLLGTDLALKLIRLLLNKSMVQDDQSKLSNISGKTILDIVNGCWMMTALKEKEASKSQEALDKKLLGDFEKMEIALDSRLSVAGTATTAVEQMNTREKAHFVSICNQQRKELYSLIAWEFRYLLAIQQELLTKAGMPYFNGATADSTSIQIQANICTFLHSAFYLRNRIGEKAHVTMLVGQESKLTSQAPAPMPIPQRQVPSLQHLPPPPPPTNMPPPPPPTQPIYAVQQQFNHPIYAAQQTVPSQYGIPPPPPAYIGSYPGQQQQKQYHYH